MSQNGQTDRSVPSGLSVMLDLYADEGDRDAIRKAYHGLAHGDPNTFAVQFSVLLTAHAQALKAYQRPDLDIQKAQVDVARQAHIALRERFPNDCDRRKPDPQSTAVGNCNCVRRWRPHDPSA